ncbi:MAG: 50S ribosomal protein L6 [Desulfuromonadaceae bacterium]|nr:50S ribosomal protein L6 [Desulfuromonadaceae bacterium]
MSRIGKKPIIIPSGVRVALDGGTLSVQGTKGKLSKVVPPGVKVDVGADLITVSLADATQTNTAMLGLARTLLANMVDGVVTGFSKVLEISGVGYRADLKGTVLNLALGYSHPIEYPLPAGIEAEVEKQTKITIRGTDKELVGATAAKIRSFREPEPYKGKGIKYADERIVRKAGKTGKK